MNRTLILSYGIISYLIFFATFLYSIGFVGNLFVPKSLDSAPQGPLWLALLINSGLLLLFALQHSVMARPAFKHWWTQYVPVAAERSTYVLFTSIALLLMYWLWRPMGGVVWHIDNDIGRMIALALFAYGWLLVLISTFLINHFDLFGLRQVWLFYRGREYTSLDFTTPGPYKWVRHPLYLGWLFAFWATPTMTVTHLFFALVTTVYIFVAIRYEERDLVTYHGERYSEYQQKVPMIFPGLGKRSKSSEPVTP